MSPPSLLPLQPIPADDRQRELSAVHLPAQETLLGYFGRLRGAADLELAPKFPEYAGKLYPLGRCREIRDDVYDRLVAHLHAPDCGTSLAISNFIRNGGIGRKIWGVLRESYFQNAMQLGPWYVDVSNDTVNPAKPQIEILPLEESGMVAVADFFHFARTARSYWQCEVFANTVFPGIAALFPMICLSGSGGVWLAAASDQMIALARSRRFQPSLDFVRRAPEPPENLAAFLRSRVSGSRSEILRADGSSEAAIEAQIAAECFEDEAFYRNSIEAFHALSQLLTPS